MKKKSNLAPKKKLKQELGAVVLKELEVRAARPEEMDRVRELLGKEHPQRARRECLLQHDLQKLV